MIRVLQVVNIMDRAGAETMLMNYYRNIDRSQVQFDFLTHRSAVGTYDNEIRSLGGHVYQAPRLYPKNYPAYFRFMKVFWEEHPEYKIVHSHIDTMSSFPLSTAKLARIPYRIAHSHSSKLDLDMKLPLKYFAKLLLPKIANIYCACGERAGCFMFGSKKVNIIHNAIEMERFSFDEIQRAEIRKELHLEKYFVVGHVGRFCYIKNQKFLLKIVKELITSIPQTVLLLIGKGRDEKQLRQAVKELQLEDNVQFLIDRADVDRLYQAMDVLVMPSLFEGIPVVGIEAQTNGLPCLVSNKISKEILLTNNIEMMSLTQSPGLWANKILNLKRSKADDNQKKLMDAGYDVKTEANRLMNWYIKLEGQ